MEGGQVPQPNSRHLLAEESPTPLALCLVQQCCSVPLRNEEPTAVVHALFPLPSLPILSPDP